MLLSAASRRRGTSIVGAVILAASLLVALPDTADAALACRIDVTKRLDKTATFAGNGVSRYYWATANGKAVGQYNSQANVIMTTLPVGAYPALVHTPIGERTGVGAMTKDQEPEALASIDADFFITPDIRYANDIEIARGPMVNDGRIIRAFHKRQRVVGVDEALQPFAGGMGVTGFVRPELTDAKRVSIRSVNWHALPGGGVSIYTPDWSRLTRPDGKASAPRPDGAVEWVLDKDNVITALRNDQRNARKRGDPVEPRTSVIAFSKNTADLAAGVPVGTTVRVAPRQSTSTGATLMTAVGRGLPMIEDGRPAPLGCDAYVSESNRPRTFVGWDAKGRWRSFTVPGSKLEKVNGVLLRTGGFGLASAANIAESLGMTYAYELDGGGSTTLWTRTRAKWHRRDLYQVANPTRCTCERWMPNGLAFVQPTP